MKKFSKNEKNVNLDHAIYYVIPQIFPIKIKKVLEELQQQGIEIMLLDCNFIKQNRYSHKNNFLLLVDQSRETLFDLYPELCPFATDQWNFFSILGDFSTVDLILNLLLFDVSQLKQRAEPLKRFMEKTKEVRVLGPGTDITFRIQKNSVTWDFDGNQYPQGELGVFAERDSINGMITYNVPILLEDKLYHQVQLFFRHGEIVENKCEEGVFPLHLQQKFNWKFAFGLHPNISTPTYSRLDAKMIGSFHFSPVSATGITVLFPFIQRTDYGDGEIYFDHMLIRKDGMFVLSDLLPLNYHLK